MSVGDCPRPFSPRRYTTVHWPTVKPSRLASVQTAIRDGASRTASWRCAAASSPSTCPHFRRGAARPRRLRIQVDPSGEVQTVRGIDPVPGHAPDHGASEPSVDQLRRREDAPLSCRERAQGRWDVLSRMHPSSLPSRRPHVAESGGHGQHRGHGGQHSRPTGHHRTATGRCGRDRADSWPALLVATTRPDPPLSVGQAWGFASARTWVRGGKGPIPGPLTMEEA